jgi:antitoxin component of MazEF toxin-antitoxin module
MHVFEAVPKEWGNSIGITIPREVVEKENISTKTKVRFIAIGSEMRLLKKEFGSLKLKKPTQKAMDEIDKGYD